MSPNEIRPTITIQWTSQFRRARQVAEAKKTLPVPRDATTNVICDAPAPSEIESNDNMGKNKNRNSVEYFRQSKNVVRRPSEAAHREPDERWRVTGLRKNGSVTYQPAEWVACVLTYHPLYLHTGLT